MQFRSGLTASSVEELLASRGWSRISCATSAFSFRIVLEREGAEGQRTYRLSKREYSAAQLFARGLSSKEVGAELRIAAATARGAVERSRCKLGLYSTAQLPLFWHTLDFPCAPPRREGRREVFSFECNLEGLPAAVLSETERILAMHVLLGQHNDEIARCRKVSSSTIANQLHSVFRKLRVSSRGELIVALLSAAARDQAASAAPCE